MRWRKLGLLFCPNGEYDWTMSHAAVPCADRVEGDLHRIYFTSRDRSGRSQIGFLEVDIQEPRRILRVTPQPVVPVGKLGAFDDSGAMMSWLVSHEDKKYLYYVGWNLGVTVPFRNAIGLAISEDGGKTFSKYSQGPLLDRDTIDPYFLASSCVVVDNGLWRMWYLSCVEWKLEEGQPKHYYHIKYAESRDGLRWQKSGRVCIDFQSPSEYAISRPCVLKEGGLYKMWYSYRGQRYRIGYAESTDGLSWVRRDETAGMTVSASGWDAEMVEFAFVFQHRNDRYMLYNGNGYGKSGFGLAVSEPEPASLTTREDPRARTV